MKRNTFTCVVLLSSALAFPAFAEKVKIEQLPLDVQRRVRAATGDAVIEDIDKETRNGKTTYEVGFKKNGQHTELQFEETPATPAPAASVPAVALDSRRLTYGELPRAV